MPSNSLVLSYPDQTHQDKLQLNYTTKCHNINLDSDKLVQAMTFELDLNDFSSPKTMPVNNIIIIDIVVDNVNYLD